MRAIARLVRGVWCCACIIALVYPSRMASVSPAHLSHHWYELQMWWMVALSFPIGLIYYLALTMGLGALHAVFGLEFAGGGLFTVAVMWAPAACAGYWQWFIWLPGWMRRLRGGSDADGST